MKPKALLPLLLALLAPRTAEAQEGKPVEVTVRPGGQPWSIGDRGAGMECSPTCILHLLPRSYRVSMGETSEDIYIDAPSEIAYRPPVRPLRYSGGALMGVGLVAGGVLTLAAATLCTGTTQTTLPDGTVMYVSKTCEKPILSRTGQYALIGVAAGSFATAVVGGILFYLGGESIKVRDLSPRTSSRFTFDVSGHGASVGWSVRF